MAQVKGKFPHNKAGNAITIILTTLVLATVPFISITDNVNSDELAVAAEKKVYEIVKEVDSVKASQGGVFDKDLTNHVEENVQVSFGEYPMRTSTASIDNVDYTVNITIPQIGKSGETDITKVKMTYYSATGSLTKEVFHMGFPKNSTDVSNEQIIEESTK